MEEETHNEVQRLDPETEFLLSSRQTGTERELFKESVKPLKQGRKVEILNDSLKSHNDNRLKKSLLEHQRSIYLLCLNSLTQLEFLERADKRRE
ncbi:hypothetical protein FH972_009998 [Carpinus fangiana]|uniref:Uncharacterized protein n=1 Tax=Carpinus fangiana TaxID=176857 RepID=A0A660KT27_9ROSI|nr:hypothetical protein FH972_009998 [Carpinus fangiana]